MKRKAEGEYRVHVVDYGRATLMMRYKDPISGKQVTRSTGTNRRKDAEREAAKWEAELQEGRYVSPSKMTWDDFRTRYEDEVLNAMAAKTAAKVATVFDAVERFINPDKLVKLTGDQISRLQAKLREPEEGKRSRNETTIKSYLVHLTAALSWAVTVGLLREVPKVKMPQRAKGGKLMKGRPITPEEFDRMLDAVPKALWPPADPDDARKQPQKKLTAEQAAEIERHRSAVVESWRHYLRGLYWSGLRLEESLELYWDREDKLHVDLSGKRPMLRIPARLEKGNQDRLLPIAPEFAEFLLATPVGKRRGPVFNPMPKRPKAPRVKADRAGKIVALIGEKALVKVSQDGALKYASAHDLRRSFGERWASRVMPQQLMELMRHESIETTMRYYVGRNAQKTADVCWAALEAERGKQTGNSDPNSAPAQDQAIDVSRESNSL